MSMLNTANSIPGDLTKVLFQGHQAITDQAIKQVKLGAEIKASLQQQQTALSAVAMMTGLGTKVDTMA